jgi:hypothetical protein
MTTLRNNNLRAAWNHFSVAKSNYSESNSKEFVLRMTDGLMRLTEALNEIDTKLDILVKRK